MAKLIVDGVEYAVPDEDDFELGELAELARLRDKFGDIGTTIALVWIVRHRADSSFTVEQAMRVKVSQIVEEETADADPLAIAEPRGNDTNGDSSASSTVPSETPAGSGIQ